MNAVAARFPADNHDQIAFARFLSDPAFGEQSDVAAIDQRITDKTLIKNNRPVDGGDPHLVAVIPHAAHHPFHDAFGMERAGGEFGEIHIRRRETKHVRAAHRFGAKPRSQNVPDHTAHAGIGAAEGFQR